jgi:hypothetical protein
MKNGGRAVLAAAAVLVLAAGTARAQGPATGYVFGTPGQVKVESFSTNTVHLGGGGEYLVGGVVGVGGEIGYLAPTQAWGDGIGVLSANGSYHFRGAGKLVPYLTAGYSRLFDGEGAVNALNVGGGANYWFAPRAALRVELRDHIHSEDGTTGHFWGVRFGVSFR